MGSEVSKDKNSAVSWVLHKLLDDPVNLSHKDFFRSPQLGSDWSSKSFSHAICWGLPPKHVHPTLSYSGMFVFFAVFISYLSLNSFDSTSGYLSLVDHQTPFYFLCLLCLAIISHCAGNDIGRNFGKMPFFAVGICFFISFFLHWIFKRWGILGIWFPVPMLLLMGQNTFSAYF